MWKALKARFFQGYRTGSFPQSSPPNLPARFAGRPLIDQAACDKKEECVEICPVRAVSIQEGKLAIDTGKCIFCGKCADICKGITFSKEYRLAAMKKEDLVAGLAPYTPPEPHDRTLADFCGKSLKIRQVSAGGCAACELDFNVLNTLAWDMGRFGIQVVASPRHADCILITGPVSRNMLLALKKTYDAAPRPVWVIACGACAVSGGLYQESSQCSNRADEILKVDLYVPGCPPHPATLLEGILRLMGKGAGPQVKE